MTVCRPRVITLLTDFGNQDAYVGIMKGVIAGINPFVNIVDTCHTIPPQDVFTGAYLLYTSYKYFPRKTIHVAVIDPGVGSRRDIVCVETEDYFFLAPDNGILSFVVQNEKPKRIVRVVNSKYFLPLPSNTFHGRDIFSPVAAHLSLGLKTQQLGVKLNHLKQLYIPTPVLKKTVAIEGYVIHIDRFGNLITNITENYIAHFKRKTGIRNQRPETSLRKPETFEKSLEEKIPAMKTTIGKKSIWGFCTTYAEAKAGAPIVLPGSAGFLEVSINQGNAQKYFKVERGDKIRIEMVSC